VGELYFELHRGTYTTQAANKRDNRKCELLLRDVEFLSAMSVKTNARFDYPSEEIEYLWKVVLLNQFHDILPGSSIGPVYEDSKKHYAEVKERAGELRDHALDGLFPAKKLKSDRACPVNTIGFARSEVATHKGKPVFVETPSHGVGRVVEAPNSVALAQSGKRITLENSRLKAILSTGGRLLSLIEKSTGREAIVGEGNRFQMYEDRPTAWDAWDVDPFHLETARDCGPSESAKIVSNGPLRAEIEFSYTIGQASCLKQIVRLDANSPRLEFHCKAEWHESDKFLKVCFPVNVRAMNATYEIPFGAVERPTHFNTPADLARFEVPGHKWADLSEHGFGVALLTESKYGYSTFNNEMRISLLRAPKYPDPNADMGRHEFAYAIYPHAGDWRAGGVVGEAARFNSPVLFVAGSCEPMTFATVDDPNLVLDTIKKAEDSRAIVLRFYECHGARGRARVKVGFPAKSASLCNLMEDEIESMKLRDDQLILDYTPFQIISVILH
jgi:alpha-mannosidase